MREQFKMFQTLIAFITSFFGGGALAQCPNPALGETAQDCPWAQVTRLTDGMTDSTAIRKIIDREIPGFMDQIDSDGNSRGLLDLWGFSRNIDESNLAKGLKTIPTQILSTFNSVLRVPYDQDFIFGHAGLNHTYGYLFSNMTTPFGYKRARYVKGELEAGFALPEGIFSGKPAPTGTLLSNLSYFIGTIAFRDHVGATATLQNLVDNEIDVADEILGYNYASLSVKTLVETIKDPSFSMELRTDIVKFPYANPNGTNTSLLIYTIQYNEKGKHSLPKLITAFPVAESFGAGIFDAKNLGENMPIKLKYNAALPAKIPAEKLVGRRFIKE